MKLSIVVIFLLALTIMSSSTSSLTPTTVKKNTRQLVREIQACKSNVSQALVLVKDSTEEGPHLAALHVCGKAKRHDVAMELYRTKMPTSESCRALAIAVCGKCGEYQQALKLLRETPTTHNSKQQQVSIQSYNAAIAACGHAHQWKEALHVLEHDMPTKLVSTFTCNAVLTALAKCKRGTEAFQLIKDMKSLKYPADAKPDRNSYNHAIQALAKQGKLETCLFLFKEMKQHPDTFPNDQTYELLITAHSKRKQWEMARTLERERQEQQQNDGTTTTNDHKTSSNKPQADIGSFDFWDMKNMTKVGRGKYARWEFGTYQPQCNGKPCLTIAIHPHRNPAKNGISLILVDNTGTTPKKLGYAIMVNSATANTSTLLGVYVDPQQRKKGYSKVFLALWFYLCRQASIQPKTGIINKPLLALVLQYTFCCIPQPGQGVHAELSVGKEGAVVLYSSQAKDLAGAFSPKDVKRERLEFIQYPAEPRGRQVRIGAAFSPPVKDEVLKESVDKVLAGSNGNGKVSHGLTSHEVRRLFLGGK